MEGPQQLPQDETELSVKVMELEHDSMPKELHAIQQCEDEVTGWLVKQAGLAAPGQWNVMIEGLSRPAAARLAFSWNHIEPALREILWLRKALGDAIAMDHELRVALNGIEAEVIHLRTRAKEFDRMVREAEAKAEIAELRLQKVEAQARSIEASRHKWADDRSGRALMVLSAIFVPPGPSGEAAGERLDRVRELRTTCELPAGTIGRPEWMKACAEAMKSVAAQFNQAMESGCALTSDGVRVFPPE